jgi:carbonic anhydrase/acetyltransferase-like protein (isoleucine patch superfamily)
MLIEHRGKTPQVHASAYVAPAAVVCGAVHIGADARILFGACSLPKTARSELASAP